MSDAGRAYVIRHSPYRGARYTIHLMVGDVANDMHDNRFWMSVGRLARKARTSRPTALEALQTMCDDGMLHRVTPENIKTGRPIEYEFLMPPAPIVYDEVTSGFTPQVSSGATPGGKPVATQVTSGLTLTKETTEGTEDNSPDPFDEFWKVYPLKVAKGSARTAFKTALKKADARRIIAGAREYARQSRGKERTYIAHPPTWLRAERWDDEDQPSASSPRIVDGLAWSACSRCGQDRRVGELVDGVCTTCRLEGDGAVSA